MIIMHLLISVRRNSLYYFLNSGRYIKHDLLNSGSRNVRGQQSDRQTIRDRTRMSVP